TDDRAPLSFDRRETFHATSDTAVRDPGMVFAEYTLVTGIVVLTAGLALHALGVPLVQAYYTTKLFILLPVP
ncbi:MAG: hypothetical protein KJN97_02680, partial [Deltaproteobacteria bacterium]|nr:hypothetical protein [Deltaproteobacteria bacterium]